jgi:hypothetical protein
MADGDLARLKQAAARVQQLSDASYGALQSPCELMAGKAWVGPTARAFDGDLQGHQSDLQKALRDAVELAQQAVNRAASRGA